MNVITGIFLLVVFGIVSETIVKIAKARSAGRQLSRPLQAELDELRRQLQEQGGVLADTQATLNNQDQQLQELHERVDFAERLLAQHREQQKLGSVSEKPAP